MAKAASMAAEKRVNDDELEENWVAAAVDVSDEEDAVSAGSEDEFEEEQDLELAPVKRPRADSGGDGDQDMADAEADGDAEQPAPAKKQKTEAKQAKPSKGLHKMTAAEHFKIVNDVYAKHKGGQMTSLELAMGLNESHFAAPKGLGKHKLELLPAYIYNLMPGWKKEFVGKGKRHDKSPYFIIICSSAIRAVEVYKQLAGSLKCRIGKLFAKHIKVSEQAEQLEKIFFPVSVGTAGRVKKLLEMNALSLQHTTHVIIDMQKDKKQMTILELKDTSKEVMELLEFHLLARLNEQKMKLVLY